MNSTFQGFESLRSIATLKALYVSAMGKVDYAAREKIMNLSYLSQEERVVFRDALFLHRTLYREAVRQIEQSEQSIETLKADFQTYTEGLTQPEVLLIMTTENIEGKSFEAIAINNNPSLRVPHRVYWELQHLLQCLELKSTMLIPTPPRSYLRQKIEFFKEALWTLAFQPQNTKRYS